MSHLDLCMLEVDQRVKHEGLTYFSKRHLYLIVGFISLVIRKQESLYVSQPHPAMFLHFPLPIGGGQKKQLYGFSSQILIYCRKSLKCPHLTRSPSCD